MKALKSEPDMVPAITMRPPRMKTAAVSEFWTRVTTGTYSAQPILLRSEMPVRGASSA